MEADPALAALKSKRGYRLDRSEFARFTAEHGSPL